MDCAARKKLLKEAKTFPEVMSVLQEAKISTSGMELARTAYQIREAQPSLATHFLDTVIKEMEDAEKKEQEYVGGESHQATNRAEPLEQKQKNTPDGEKPDTGATGTENQMREDIMGQIDPSILSQMMPQNCPPMSMPQQIKQMQYTVSRMLAPITTKLREVEAENTRLKSAITELDTKVRETVMSAARTMPLNIDPRGRNIKETTNPVPLPILTSQPLDDKRFEISELDRQMKNGTIKAADIYQ